MNESSRKSVFCRLAQIVVGAICWAVLATSAHAQSIFTTQAPSAPDISDGVPYELGMKFRSAKSGQITSIRHYKAASDTATHVGRIWNATGTLLASITFTGESASGWQQQALTAPLSISANTTYIVSVNVASHFPFTQGGLATAITNADLSSVADGLNGVYGGSGTFPTSSYQNSNYFRDIVFVADAAGVSTITKVSGDNQSASVSTLLPNPFVVQVRSGTNTPVSGTTITFAVMGGGGSITPISAVTDASGNASTRLTLGATPGTNTVSATAAAIGTVTFSAAAGVPTITKTSGDNQSGSVSTVLPNPMVVQVRSSTNVPVSGATVNFVVTGGGGSIAPISTVTDASGNASTLMTLGATAGTNTVSATAASVGSVSFSATGTPMVTGGQSIFTTQIPNNTYSDGVGYELGMKFRSAKAGKISAIRYWKAVNDTGTHIGRIWDSAGNLLASATFTGETASGWQQQALATPLNISLNTTYIVSANIINFFVFTGDGLASAIVNGDLSTVADGSTSLIAGPGQFPSYSVGTTNYFRDVVFVADAVPALGISKVSGDNQSGAPGAALVNPLVVQVKDANNLPKAGVTVTFTAATGSGSVSPTSAVTGADGRASTSLTLGTIGGLNTATASSAGIGTLTFSAISDANPIYLENQNAGASSWRIGSYTATDIAGYASALSVQRGGSIGFRTSVATPGAYTIQVYRFGYYGGAGARLMFTSPSLSGITQPACPMTNTATRLVECNWTTRYTLAVGANWISGLYMAKLRLTSSGKESPIFFVVRNDASTSKILFQSSFTTSAAYNRYGGYSLYDFSSTGGQRAYKVSFDRPTKELEEYTNVLRYEYNMIRWMESQGYDVSYVTNLDIHTNPGQLSQHKVFMDAGHDEYWSLEMRNAVENARNAGMHLAFFSANTAYWRVRFEASTSGVANRVMVCYKTTSPADPVAPTIRFRDAPNNRPENALMGVMYIGDHGQLYGGFDHVVTNAADPYYAFTGLNNGDKLTGLVGYEWDAIVSNGFTPNGVVTLGSSTVTPTEIAPGIPSTPTQTVHAVRYTAASGGKVFSSGSIQWVWGLDSDRGFDFVTPPRVDVRAQQMFVNILRDMGVRPATPNANLVVP